MTPMRVYLIKGQGLNCTCLDATGEPAESVIAGLQQKFKGYALEFVGERPELKEGEGV